MSGYTIAPIVEGDGEVQAVPVLLRRICMELLGVYDVTIRKPWRLPRGKMTKAQEMLKVIDVISHGIGDGGGIIVILDQDDDACVVELAESLVGEASISCPVEVVVACREYEAWFLAAIESLRPHKSVKPTASYAGNPELPRDAKKRLELNMLESYRETLHQSAFSGVIDLTAAASRSRSFARMVSATKKLTSTEPA